MIDRVLITGGAGFIGSHLTDQLLASGRRVKILDNLSPQVHGPGGKRPSYLAPEAELIVGDVRDANAVARALEGVDAVVHLAAAVGVGQSMYCIREYTDVNNVGTAVVLEQLAKRRVARLVVASSMSIYGEGRYSTADGRSYDDAERSHEQLRQGRWEPRLPDGSPLCPVATPETKSPKLSSVYALSKYDQEKMCLMLGRAYEIPTVALRFFNTYGPRQALSNPYTGVLAIFAARLLHKKPPLVFEDGLQRRDFVSVHDVARACLLALDAGGLAYEAVNVASGRSLSIRDVARELALALGCPEIVAEVAHRHRLGDVRHCFADVSSAKSLLGFEATIDLQTGLEELAAWLRAAKAIDRSELAQRELAARGFTL